MIGVLVACILVLIMRNFYPKLARVVVVYDVEHDDEEDNTSYTCRFMYRGEECSGHFFFPGQLPEVLVAKIVGLDCLRNVWELELLHK